MRDGIIDNSGSTTTTEVDAETFGKLHQIKHVLERWEISGINRKLQLKPRAWKEEEEEEEEGDHGSGGGVEEEDGGDAVPPPAPSTAAAAADPPAAASGNANAMAAEGQQQERTDDGKVDGEKAPGDSTVNTVIRTVSSSAADKEALCLFGGEGKPGVVGGGGGGGGRGGGGRGSQRAAELLLILKWGGELTNLGQRQAIELGNSFRTIMYPDSGSGGLLRLHRCRFRFVCVCRVLI